MPFKTKPLTVQIYRTGPSFLSVFALKTLWTFPQASLSPHSLSPYSDLWNVLVIVTSVPGTTEKLLMVWSDCWSTGCMWSSLPGRIFFALVFFSHCRTAQSHTRRQRQRSYSLAFFLCSPFSACFMSALLPSSLLITWETWSSAPAPLWITIFRLPGKTRPSFASNTGFLLYRTTAPFYCTRLIVFKMISPHALSHTLKLQPFRKDTGMGEITFYPFLKLLLVIFSTGF